MTARRNSRRGSPTPYRPAAALATWLVLAFAFSSPSPAATVATAANVASAASAEALVQEATARLATRRTADLEASLELFSEAARRDPSHARAHAGVATAASLLALYSVAPPHPLFATARAAALEALRLEPELATAQAAMGLIEYLDGWSFAPAEKYFLEALRLDPAYATAWHWYGMLLMATMRFDESIAAFDHAISIEPGSALFHAKRAGVLAAAGRDDGAERDLRRAVELFPESALARRELGYLLVRSGRPAEGLASLREAAERSGVGTDESADLGWAYARTGHAVEAEAIVARLIEPSATSFVSPLDPALVYAGLDRRDDAFRWLNAALELRDPGLVYLATAPGFATLRSDPRFAALLHAIGLPGAPR